MNRAPNVLSLHHELNNSEYWSKSNSVPVNSSRLLHKLAPSVWVFKFNLHSVVSPKTMLAPPEEKLRRRTCEWFKGIFVCFYTTRHIKTWQNMFWLIATIVMECCFAQTLDNWVAMLWPVCIHFNGRPLLFYVNIRCRRRCEDHSLRIFTIQYGTLYRTSSIN